MKRLLIDGSEDYITTEALRQTTIPLIQPLAVLIVVRGMILARDFPVAVNVVPVTINQDMKALRPGACFFSVYLAYQLNVIRQAFFAIREESAHGTKCLRTELWKSLAVAIPPLDEQRSIVAFLDRETAKIDALMAKKKRLIELLQEKRTALISHAVTKGLDPAVPMKDSGTPWVANLPAKWRVTKLKHVSTIQTGLTLGKEYANKATVRRPYLRVANVQDGYLDLERITDVEVPLDGVSRHELRPGDVLMTEGGDFDKLGRGYIWEGQISGCLHQNHIFAVRPRHVVLEPRFLTSLMTSAHGKYYFTTTSQKSTNLASTNSTKLGDFPFALPALHAQQDILAFLERETAAIDSLITKVQDAIDKLREYRTALISAAVTGKIDVSSETVTVVDPAISPEKPAAKPANPYFRRSVFAAEIIDRLCDEPTFGHVKFQKCLFVAQHHLRVEDFEENYKRMAAGPYDNRLVRSVDSQLEKSRWFKAEKVGDRYAYRRLDKAGGHRQYFERYFGEHAEQLAKLIALFHPLDTDRAEIVATLYAVWNDFLLRDEACDDDRIVAEVLTNWHDRKKRFEEDRWRRALGWMRDKGLVPSGFGKPTVMGDGEVLS